MNKNLDTGKPSKYIIIIIYHVVFDCDFYELSYG